jgi:hypothetical protein
MAPVSLAAVPRPPASAPSPGGSLGPSAPVVTRVVRTGLPTVGAALLDASGIDAAAALPHVSAAPISVDWLQAHLPPVVRAGSRTGDGADLDWLHAAQYQDVSRSTTTILTHLFAAACRRLSAWQPRLMPKTQTRSLRAASSPPTSGTTGDLERAILGVSASGDAPGDRRTPPRRFAALLDVGAPARARRKLVSRFSACDARWHLSARVPHASSSLPCCNSFGVALRSLVGEIAPEIVSFAISAISAAIRENDILK